MNRLEKKGAQRQQTTFKKHLQFVRAIYEGAKKSFKQFEFNRYKFRKLKESEKMRLQKMPRKTLVLDLDETLIYYHCYASVSQMKTDIPYDYFFIEDCKPFFIRKRPHVDYFLEMVAQWYDIVIYTSTKQDYADEVLKHLDEGRSLFNYRLYRQDCRRLQNGKYVKDLTKVDSDYRNVCIIDDKKMSFYDFPNNGIQIKSWQWDTKDRALLNLLPILDRMRLASNVCDFLCAEKEPLYVE